MGDLILLPNKFKEEYKDCRQCRFNKKSWISREFDYCWRTGFFSILMRSERYKHLTESCGPQAEFFEQKPKGILKRFIEYMRRS